MLGLTPRAAGCHQGVVMTQLCSLCNKGMTEVKPVKVLQKDDLLIQEESNAVKLDNNKRDLSHYYNKIGLSYTPLSTTCYGIFLIQWFPTTRMTVHYLK